MAPSVRLLAWILNNGIDDDVNGQVDDSRELYLIAFDDDENGHLDDIHGADIALGRTAPFGALWEGTHDDHAARDSEGHATSVAGVLGAETHNGQFLPSVAPNVEIVPVTIDFRVLPDVNEYLSLVRAQIANLSFGPWVRKLDGQMNDEFLAEILGRTTVFHATKDPNILYVLSAGNEGQDLDALTNEMTGPVVTSGPDGKTRWRWPQSITPRPGLTVAASNGRDELAERFLGCGSFDFANEATWLTCIDGKAAAGFQTDHVLPDVGSNFGAETVDLAAPGDAIGTLRIVGDDIWPILNQASGTSFSAPIVAGVAAVLLGRWPDLLVHRPWTVADVLRATAETNASSGTGTFVGKTEAPGRVDLRNALDYMTNTPPTPSPWHDASHELGDARTQPTAGAALFEETVYDAQAGGGVPLQVLVRVYAGRGDTGVVPIPPTRHDRRPPQPAWKPQLTPLTYMAGSYSDVAALDLDGNQCRDLVLAGRYQTNDPPGPGEASVKASATRVLLQGRATAADGNAYCTGTFDLPPAFQPAAEEVYWAVSLADLDGDGRSDIVLPGFRRPNVPGGNHPPRLLRSEPAGLVDDSALLPEDSDLHGYALAVCDLDNDGDLDVVEAGQASPALGLVGRRPRVYLNTVASGPFGFTALDSAAAGLPELYMATSIACVDLDGNGHRDLLFARAEGPANVLLLNNGGLTFTDASGLLPVTPDPQGPFAYIERPLRTWSVSACHTVDDPSRATVLYGNGEHVEFVPQPNLAFRFDPFMNVQEAATAMGLDFAHTLDRTKRIVCADLDQDALDDAILVLNHGGRDYLYLAEP